MNRLNNLENRKETSDDKYKYWVWPKCVFHYYVEYFLKLNKIFRSSARYISFFIQPFPKKGNVRSFNLITFTSIIMRFNPYDPSSSLHWPSQLIDNVNMTILYFIYFFSMSLGYKVVKQYIYLSFRKNCLKFLACSPVSCSLSIDFRHWFFYLPQVDFQITEPLPFLFKWWHCLLLNWTI